MIEINLAKPKLMSPASLGRACSAMEYTKRAAKGRRRWSGWRVFYIPPAVVALYQLHYEYEFDFFHRLAIRETRRAKEALRRLPEIVGKLPKVPRHAPPHSFHASSVGDREPL